MFGYMGKLLRVDLSQSKFSEEPIDPNKARDYIGGVGLATRIIYDEVPFETHPLDPGNKLLFFTGPMTATSFPTTARYTIATKSPLTGIWLDAGSSGYWGNFFKRTGYDGIIVEGKSEKPVYLWVTDDHAELRDASAIWGQDAMTAQQSIKDELGNTGASVACIGPAGEKQVLLSCIINDNGQAAARGGGGAVMGSKNLKAIAVKGTKKVAVAAEGYFRMLVKQYDHGLTTSPAVHRLNKYGTSIGLDKDWQTGDVPVKNWSQGIWKEGSINVGGKRIVDTILVGRGACLGCPIKCARRIKIEKGQYKMEGIGPQYESLAMFGPMLLNDNLEAACWLNDLCNRYGIDTVSAGSAIAFAMEAYEKGLITKADAGGMDLSWGNLDVIIELTRQIGEKRGLGELLGQGVKRAAEQIGGGSEAFAVHVKGMEVPAHDPRCYFSMAVNYATSPRGACHNRGLPLLYEVGIITPEAGITYKQGRFDRDGKGLAAKVAQDAASVLNSLIVCEFAALGLAPSMLGMILSLVTGNQYSGQDILKVGERITNLQRMFNLGCGITTADDKLPKRLLEPTPDGGHAGKVPDVAHQLKEYYAVRGWTPDGVPTADKLRELDLEFAGAAMRKGAKEGGYNDALRKQKEA